MTARQVFDRLLAATLANSVDDMIAVYADDVLIEMPFRHPDRPRSSAGAGSLRERLAAAAAQRRFTGADEVVVHETADPDEVVAELRLHGENVETGEAFASRHVMFVRVDGERIVRSRDYSQAVPALTAR